MAKDSTSVILKQITALVAAPARRAVGRRSERKRRYVKAVTASRPTGDDPQARETAREGKMARVILVRSNGLKQDDLSRWHPTLSPS